MSRRRRDGGGEMSHSCRCPLGRLAKLARCSGNAAARLQFCDDYLEDSQEYYFERPANVFYYIYNFYATGDLHRAPDVCHEQYMKELQYWNIAYLLIPKCCRKADTRYATALEAAAEVQSRTGAGARRRAGSVDADSFAGLCLGDWRRTIWCVTENPDYSRAGKVFTVVSIGFIVVAITVLVMGSIPDLQDAPGTNFPFDLVSDAVSSHSNQRNQSAPAQKTIPQPVIELQIIELFCNTWFTLEFAGRFLVSPYKLHFVRETMNLVDLLAIVPFYLELLLAAFGESDNSLLGAFAVIRVMRVLRVVRIFKLARYSEGLQAFVVTLKRSLRQLGLMVMLLGMCVLFFSTLVYYMENEVVGSKFHSIPSAFWWCLVTMTTVGYGDIVPVTIMGRLIGSGAILLGTLVVALPITVIVENFQRTMATIRRRASVRSRRRTPRRAATVTVPHVVVSGTAEHRKVSPPSPPVPLQLPRSCSARVENGIVRRRNSAPVQTYAFP